MRCTECGHLVESPTHFEESLNVCFACLRASIPKIEPKIKITRALGKLKCVFCLGTIISFQEPKKIDKLTDGAINGIIGMHHPSCKTRFLDVLYKRGYSPLKMKKKRRKYKSKRKKKVQNQPTITSKKDMEKWITKQD